MLALGLLCAEENTQSKPSGNCCPAVMLLKWNVFFQLMPNKYTVSAYTPRFPVLDKYLVLKLP